MNAADNQRTVKTGTNAPSLQIVAAQWLHRLAWASFGAALIILPWRLALWRWSRPFPPIYADFTDILILPQDVLLLLTVASWGGMLWLRRKRPFTGPLFLWGPLLGLTLIAWLSLVAAVDRPLALVQALRLTLLLGVYLFVVNEGKRPFRIAWIFTAQLAVQAGIGLAQYALQHDLGLQWLGERRLDPLTGDFVWAEGGLRALRAYGLSDHPNILAIGVALSLLIVIAFETIVKNRFEKETGFLTQIVIWVVVGLGTAVLLTTFSRPAWIAFALGLTLTIWGRRHLHSVSSVRSVAKLPIFWFILLGIVAVFSSVQPYLRLGSTPDLIAARINEIQLRQTQKAALNHAANELFLNHAITGTGIGTMPVALQQAQPDFVTDYQPAPVNVLTIAAEIGLLGALFYGLLLVMPWLMLLMRRRRLAQSKQAGLLAGMTGVLLAITILNFSDAYTWFYPAGRLWQWVVWGLWAALYNDCSAEAAVRIQENN